MRWLLTGTAVLAMSVQSIWANAEIIWGVTGVAGAPSSLYAINPANGQLLAKIGDTGTVCLAGLAIQPGTGNLLAVQGNLSPTGASTKTLFLLNKSTGAASAIGTMASKYAISDVAMRSDGTLFAFGIGSAVKKILTVNTSTAVVTEIGNTNNITNVSLTFGSNGTLYLARTNAIFSVNQATGVTTQLAVIGGATTQIDNFMATRSDGTIYTGLRTGSNTALYTLIPATGATALVGTVSGIGLSGIVFDTIPSPTMTVTGKKKITTTRPTITLKGSATSILPLTVSTKGMSTTAANGVWTLKLKLKRGKNIFTIDSSDALGQSASGGRVTVIRK